MLITRAAPPFDFHKRDINMSNLSSDVPKTPGVITNPELPARPDSARKETDSVPREQSAPPEPTKQNQNPRQPMRRRRKTIARKSTPEPGPIERTRSKAPAPRLPKAVRPPRGTPSSTVSSLRTSPSIFGMTMNPNATSASSTASSKTSIQLGISKTSWPVAPPTSSSGSRCSARPSSRSTLATPAS